MRTVSGREKTQPSECGCMGRGRVEVSGCLNINVALSYFFELGFGPTLGNLLM